MTHYLPNPEQGHNLDLTVRKFELIQKALRSIQSMPQLSKAGVLFNSILSELSLMKDSIQSYITYQDDVKQSINFSKQQQLAQHDYIVEFYDVKIRNQQKIIKQLQQVNAQLVQQGLNNGKDLSLLQTQLLTLKQQINKLQLKQRNRQVQQTLMNQVNTLIQQLKQKDLIIDNLNQDLRANKQELERGVREDHFSMSHRILEMNKMLDSSKGQYMKLILELQDNKQQAKRDNFQLMGQMIIKQAKWKQVQNKFGMKQKEIVQLKKVVEQLSEEIQMYKHQQQKNVNFNQQLLRSKSHEQIQIQNQLQKTQQTLSTIHNRLRAKNQQLTLLQKQNIKLHQFMNQKQNQVADAQRALSMISSKYQQQKKTNQSMQFQLTQLKQQIKQLASKLDLACKFKIQLQRQRQQKMLILKQLNQKLTDYDFKFSDIRTLQLKKQQQVKQYITLVKKQYEDVISQLVSDLKVLQKSNKQLETQMKNQNNRIQLQSKQLNKQRKQIITLKTVVDQSQTVQQKCRQLQANKIILQQQIIQLKTYVKQLEVKVENNLELKKKMKDLIVDNQEHRHKELEYQEKINKLGSKFEKDVKELEARMMKLNESNAQKQFEVAELGTKNKSLLEDLANIKRNGVLEKTRLETRLNQLEKVLKDKKSFEAKVNNLVF